MTSEIARSSRFGTKCGDPQWRSEMCAIRNTAANCTGRGPRPWPLLPWVHVGEEPLVFRAYRGTVPPRFVNRAELEVALLLDFYGIPWEYEPRTFVLEEDGEGRVLEATRPDFYLPEQDLYLELTTMKQSLVTRKNRKLRKLRRLYPDVRAKLFYRRDLELLARRFGLDLAS